MPRGVVLLLFVCLCIQSIAQTKERGRVDEDSTRVSVDSLVNRIREAITKSGGDFDTQAIHLVVGFSTGHFPRDPLGADAARIIAKDLICHLVSGEMVSIYAWEIGIWNHSNEIHESVVVQGKSQAEKQNIYNLLPLSSKKGSIGGHDTENSIVEIINRIGYPSNQVIVLLTNSAASIAPPGGKVMGSNHPSYISVLNQWNRVGQETERGGSMELTFTVELPDGRKVNRKMDCVLLVPKTFSSSAISENRERCADIKTETQKPVTEAQKPVIEKDKNIPRPDCNPGLLLFFIFAAGGTGFLLWKYFGSQGQLFLVIDGNAVHLEKSSPSVPVVDLVGEGYEQLSGTQHGSRHVLTGVPPIRIASIYRLGKGIRIQAQESKIISVNDRLTTDQQSCRIEPESDYKLTFSWEHNEEGIRDQRTKEVNIELKKEK